MLFASRHHSPSSSTLATTSGMPTPFVTLKSASPFRCVFQRAQLGKLLQTLLNSEHMLGNSRGHPEFHITDEGYGVSPTFHNVTILNADTFYCRDAIWKDRYIYRP